MLLDITLKITPKMVKDASGNEKRTLVGHLGTHFDVMNKTFPLEYIKREGIIFDVHDILNRDIDIKDIDINKIHENMFVGFYSGYIDKVEYGTEEYFSFHPQLSNDLIDLLLVKKISIIGIDFAGIKRGKDHPLKDQYCADHNIFVVENLCNLQKLINVDNLFINTYPMNYAELSGLPCRVIAKF